MKHPVRPKVSVLPILVIFGILLMIINAPRLLESDTHLRSASPHSLTVCLDPGHGGKDRGCSQDDRTEADDVLRLALAIRSTMEQRGIHVIMTREKDTFPTLEERTYFANRAKADYYISIHRNFFSSSAAHGIEIWHSWRAGNTTKRLASCIEDKLMDAGVSGSRGCKGGSQGSSFEDYTVCRLTKMPAVLVEMGFLSNDEDNALFDEKLEAYAAAFADAVEQVERNQHK